ncbi:protein of unknown function [Magnetospirillum sp. XM-1]|nr:protein of unknown function [Magnetospirillum sp. XM-1]
MGLGKSPSRTLPDRRKPRLDGNRARFRHGLMGYGHSIPNRDMRNFRLDSLEPFL